MKKIISGIALALYSICSFAQADFSIVPQNLNPTIRVGDTAIVQVSIVNLGSSPLRTNSVMASTSAPGNGRFVGIRAAGSDPVWSLVFLGPEANANSIRLVNTGGSLDAAPEEGAFTNVYVYLVGVQVGSNVFTANVTFNPLKGGDSLASYAAQGNALNSNDNNTTSLIVQMPLPLDFTSINAVWSGENADVNWVVANENNNSYFSIERSFDGIHFREAGQVKSVGNYTDHHLYTYADTKIKAQTSANVFYRVKQVDNNQKYTWSNVVNLTNDKSKEEAYLFPNPVAGNLFSFVYQNRDIESANLDIHVTDASGRIVFRTNKAIVKGKNQMQVVTNHLATGNYFLNYSNDAHNIKGSIKFVKQ
jgi:hypothetical protein